MIYDIIDDLTLKPERKVLKEKLVWSPAIDIGPVP